jgi:hypothetical protein
MVMSLEDLVGGFLEPGFKWLLPQGLGQPFQVCLPDADPHGQVVGGFLNNTVVRCSYWYMRWYVLPVVLGVTSAFDVNIVSVGYQDV